MSKPSPQTLSLFSSAELHADHSELARLKAGVIDQMRVMRRLRGEEALRGILVGMTLLRIKHAAPHGTFGPWIKDNLTAFSDRYANYLMRLSLVFVDRTKVTKPELLALPGDQTELSIEGTEGAQRRFLEKAAKFVGDLSLNELLIKFNIKSVGLKTELTNSDDNDEELTPEQRSQRDRDAAWLSAWNPMQAMRSTLTDPNKLQLISDPKQIEQLKSESIEITKMLDDRLSALRAIKV